MFKLVKPPTQVLAYEYHHGNDTAATGDSSVEDVGGEAKMGTYIID